MPTPTIAPVQPPLPITWRPPTPSIGPESLDLCCRIRIPFPSITAVTIPIESAALVAIVLALDEGLEIVEAAIRSIAPKCPRN